MLRLDLETKGKKIRFTIEFYVLVLIMLIVNPLSLLHSMDAGV